MQGQDKKQRESKKLQLLPPMQGFLVEFLPAGNPSCPGGRSCGKLVEGFWDIPGALWDPNPPSRLMVQLLIHLGCCGKRETFHGKAPGWR